MSVKDASEAYRIARVTIAKAFELELVFVGGNSRMVPKNRKSDGTAVNEEDQEAADAYNWFADRPPQINYR